MIRPRFTYLPACLAGAFCALAVVAVAAATPKLVAIPNHGPGGTIVSLSGSGFCVSCGVVEIDFGATPVKRGTIVASDGSFQTSFMVPGGAQAGTNAINAYQQGVLVTQTTFDVTPSTAAPTGNPPPPSTPTPKQTPRGTPSASPTSQPSSPVSPGPSESPSPAAVATPGGLPMGVLIAILVIVAVAAATAAVVWWQRRGA